MHTHRKLIVDVAVFRKRHYARSHAQRRRRAGHDERIGRAGDQQDDGLSEAGHQSDFTVKKIWDGDGRLNCCFRWVLPFVFVGFFVLWGASRSARKRRVVRGRTG